MVNITLCNIIAYFSAVLTFFGSIFSCFFLVIDVKNLNRPVKKSDGTMWFVTESDVASMAIDTISNVAIFIASVFLIIGIKRRHHTFVAPWVFVVAICVVLNLLKLIPNQETLLQSLVSVAIQVIIWYPIFSLYQELRKTSVNPGDDYDACPTKEPSADGEAYPQKTDDNTPTETDNPTEMGH